MTDLITLNTHLFLWHTSPASIYPDIEERGIKLYREYIWCSMGPWMPIRFAKKFTGDFVLACIALPRTGPNQYLWAETRAHPDGDAAEKTYDHGGGYNYEVKLWTKIPRHLIVNFWTENEVDGIMSSGREGVIGSGAQTRTGMDIWTSGINDFTETCAALLVDCQALREVRLHAGLYLRSMGLLSSGPQNTRYRKAALLNMVCRSDGWSGDKLAVACQLLSDLQTIWLPEFLERVPVESISAKHTARILSFACFSHPREEIHQCLENGLCQGTAKILAENLLRISRSKGSDRQACENLAVMGCDSAGILVGVLLGLPLANALSNALIKTLGMMPVEVSTPALIALLRRRRDVSSKARGTINEVLSSKLPFAEEPLLHLARLGHWHSRRAARQILLYNGSQYAIQQVKMMLVDDDTETTERRNIT